MTTLSNFQSPTDLEGQNPSQEGISENKPHLLKTSQFMQAHHGLKQENVWEPFQIEKRLANPP